MTRYIVRRLGHALLVLWATFTATFLLLYALPGDAALSKAGASSESTVVDAAQVARVRAELGMDDPLVVQYLRTLKNTVTGDFGRSLQNGTPVRELYADAVPHTLQLATAGFILAILFGFGWALLVSYVQWRPAQVLLGSLPALGVSVPTFWVGLLALQWFSFKWHLFPAFGDDGIRSLVLPAVVVAIPSAAVAAQLLSRSLENTLDAPFIDTARAKGASRLRILVVHAVRNSLLPVLTALGMTAGHLIGGSVVAETVFTRPGIGEIALRAVNFQDSPVLLVAVLFAAVVFVTINLAVDILYRVVDPRIHYSTDPAKGPANLKAAA
jgi:peptide/nickel transport system permease protein